MRLAAVQFKADKADFDGSLRRLRSLAREAASGADLVVLPEMAATGYLFPSIEAVLRVAEPAGGPTVAALAPVARDAGCWLVAGFPERAEDRVFNSAAVIDPHGTLHFTYRKTLLYDADLPWATPGDSGYRRIDADWGSFGVGICMDLNDDDFVGWCAAEALDAVALPTCWVEEGVDVWSYWAVRTLTLRAALVAADTWGTEGETRFAGRSAIMRRLVVYGGTGATGDGVVSATLPGA